MWGHSCSMQDLLSLLGSLIFVAACGIFNCSMWDLVSWTGIKPGPPALGAFSSSHWTTKGVPQIFCSVQFSRSVMSTLCDPMNRSTPGLPVHHHLPEFTSIQSVMPSSHLILCHSLFLLPPIPPSIRVSSNESTLRMRWPKYWSLGPLKLKLGQTVS